MTHLDLLAYYSQLDEEISKLSDKLANEKISTDFPAYKHIGKYIDPTNFEFRKYFIQEVKQDLHNYSFDPLISFDMSQIKYSKEVLHPNCNCFRRSETKLRPIKTCSHRDRILYASWNFYLSNLHKDWLILNGMSEAVSAYVPKTGKFNADYAKKAFDYIQGRNEYSARAIDIKSFFDEIPHKILKGNIIELVNDGSILNPVNYRLFSAITNYSYIERHRLLEHLIKFESGTGIYLNRTNENWSILRDLKLIQKNKIKGIPQGLSCSGVLANISMMKFDSAMVSITEDSDSIYLRYADDIFIASPNKEIVSTIMKKCEVFLAEMKLPIAHGKTEKFDYLPSDKLHPTISYLGLECTGNKVTVRMNGVNKFYQRASQFIFSYVFTCRKRGIKPSRKKIRAIFSHSGNRNYYSYLRRSSKVFEEDDRYNFKNIKGVLRSHMQWIDKQFDVARDCNLPKVNKQFETQYRCSCPMKKDG